MRAVRIKWVDSNMHFNELSADEIDPTVELTTVGIVVKEDNTTITIARDINPTNHPETFRGALGIIKNNITSMEELNARP